MHNSYVFISEYEIFSVILRNNFFYESSDIFIVLIILVLVSSCGEYEKLLKSTDFELKKAKAKEYYDEGQYVKCYRTSWSDTSPIQGN